MSSAKQLKPVYGSLEASLSSYIFNNDDLLFCGRQVDNADGLRHLYSLHALNHIYKQVPTCLCSAQH